MATVAGIRFKKAGKVYYFDPTGVWPNPGDHVIVETIRGIEMGEAVTGAREVADDSLVAPLQKIIRIATPEDIQHAESCAAREQSALDICARKIAAHKLDMKLVDAEYTFDDSKLIFYFTANGRVDFRELVKDLAGVFKMRIELRQIGVRDEAKMLGGLGACGRPICCGAFLNDFQPVSIRMAKDQNLSLNPTKISGQCGRLMCCLNYEQDNYERILKRLPRVGREIMTPDGVGVVTEIAVIREKIKVRMRQPDDTYDVKEYGLDQVYRIGSQPPEPAPTDDELPEEAELMDLMDAPQPAEQPAPRRAARPRPPRAEQGAPREGKKPNDEAKKADQADDQGDKPEDGKPARRRYPRRKGRKQSTEQYFESQGHSEGPTEPTGPSGEK